MLDLFFVRQPVTKRLMDQLPLMLMEATEVDQNPSPDECYKTRCTIGNHTEPDD